MFVGMHAKGSIPSQMPGLIMVVHMATNGTQNLEGHQVTPVTACHHPQPFMHAGHHVCVWTFTEQVDRGSIVAMQHRHALSVLCGVCCPRLKCYAYPRSQHLRKLVCMLQVCAEVLPAHCGRGRCGPWQQPASCSSAAARMPAYVCGSSTWPLTALSLGCDAGCWHIAPRLPHILCSHVLPRSQQQQRRASSACLVCEQRKLLKPGWARNSIARIHTGAFRAC